MSSFEKFDIDFYESNYSTDNQGQSYDGSGATTSVYGSKTGWTSDPRQSEAFAAPETLSSSQPYAGQIFQPAYTSDFPSDHTYADSFDEEPPLLEGRKSSLWLCLWHKRSWMHSNSRVAEPDEHSKCALWLCGKCTGLLPATHGHPIQLCSIFLPTGNSRNSAGSDHYWMVQPLCLQNIHFGFGYGRTAISGSLSLCFTLWTFCTYDCLLNSGFEPVSSTLYLIAKPGISG
ncbi:protein YIPF7 isoform X2 [Tiliqua scincoides]|uniref:protein YIPF7 isoform X2 n=1 Tax=Tiliqua scincoides TaxID=71010 RepID=UPI003462C90C